MTSLTSSERRTDSRSRQIAAEGDQSFKLIRRHVEFRLGVSCVPVRNILCADWICQTKFDGARSGHESLQRVELSTPSKFAYRAETV